MSQSHSAATHKISNKTVSQMFSDISQKIPIRISNNRTHLSILKFLTENTAERELVLTLNSYKHKSRYLNSSHQTHYKYFKVPYCPVKVLGLMVKVRDKLWSNMGTLRDLNATSVSPAQQLLRQTISVTLSQATSQSLITTTWLFLG
jgi:hypothetical protein